MIDALTVLIAIILIRDCIKERKKIREESCNSTFAGDKQLMYWAVKDVIPYLDESKISYSIDGTSIRVPLPNNFGTLGIGDVDNEYDIIYLEGENWHDHLHSSDKIFEFIKDIFEGNELLIEIIKDGKPVRRNIICKCGLACFKEIYEEEGITIKIYNLI